LHKKPENSRFSATYSVRFFRRGLTGSSILHHLAVRQCPPHVGKVPAARPDPLARQQVHVPQVLKHWVNKNSVKLYDKGSVLRAETTLRQPGDFKVYRPAEGRGEQSKAWRPLRRGIADLHRRATVSQAANERYLNALVAVHDRTPLRQLAEPVCCPVLEPTRRRCGGADQAAAQSGQPQPQAAAPAPAAAVGAAGPKVPESTAGAGPAAGQGGRRRRRRLRALNPLGKEDGALLEAVSGHEFLLNGLRNRDVRRLLYGAEVYTWVVKKC
jgi:hypothetical protein